MSIVLLGLGNEKPVAMPAFRTFAVVDGLPEQDDVTATLLAIHDLFLEAFGGEVAFAAIKSPRGTAGRLVKASDKKRKDCRAVIEDQLQSKHGIRYYGSDKNVLELPHLPFLSIERKMAPGGGWTILIEVSVPADSPDLMSLADRLHAELRKLPLMEGYQGYGWNISPVSGFDDRILPPAHRRYRAALMGTYPRFLLLQYHDPYFAERFDEYEPGISDVGWRTYVGAPFMDRLGEPDRTKGVTVEKLSKMAVVTAGPSPIWGDIEKGEDLSAMRAAFEIVKPAWATRGTLVRFTLGWDDTVPSWARNAEQYLDRLETDVAD